MCTSFILIDPQNPKCLIFKEQILNLAKGAVALSHLW